jgi:hypothetical protein
MPFPPPALTAGPYLVGKAQTHCTVIIAGNTKTFDLSNAVVNVQTNKHINSKGSATIICHRAPVLVKETDKPDTTDFIDYISDIEENFGVKIYFSAPVFGYSIPREYSDADYLNANDPSKNIPPFYGFVDGVRKSVSTNQLGATITQYEIYCSDFQKPLEETQIYTTPYLLPTEGALREFAGTLTNLQLFLNGFPTLWTPRTTKKDEPP